jgi:hypothetical protein
MEDPLLKHEEKPGETQEIPSRPALSKNPKPSALELTNSNADMYTKAAALVDLVILLLPLTAYKSSYKTCLNSRSICFSLNVKLDI